MSIDAKDFLDTYLALKQFGQNFWVAIKYVTRMTDSQSVSRISQQKDNSSRRRSWSDGGNWGPSMY